jgi:hypothetical protein
MQLHFDLMNARYIKGKKDVTKTYTIVDGVVTLPNGMRAFCEAFLNEHKAFQAGPHMLECEIEADRERRLVVRVVTCVPVAARQAAPAPARAA